MLAAISDRDRNAFQEAHNTVLDNFTEEEQVRIGKLAADLKAILDAAKKRQQDRLGKSTGF